MSGGEARNRDAVGRTRNVVEIYRVAKNHARRLAAMLAADADLQITPRRTPALCSHLHELPHAFAVEDDERVARVGDPLEGGRVARGDEPRLLIALECSRGGELTLVRGEEEPFAGWWSPRLESVQPAWFCAWGALAAGPIELVALLWPLRGNEVWPEPELAVTREGGETVVAYTTPAGRHTVEFSLEAPEPVRSSIAATQPLEGAAL